MQDMRGFKDHPEKAKDKLGKLTKFHLDLMKQFEGELKESKATYPSLTKSVNKLLSELDRTTAVGGYEQIYRRAFELESFRTHH